MACFHIYSPPQHRPGQQVKSNTLLHTDLKVIHPAEPYSFGWAPSVCDQCRKCVHCMLLFLTTLMQWPTPKAWAPLENREWHHDGWSLLRSMWIMLTFLWTVPLFCCQGTNKSALVCKGRNFGWLTVFNSTHQIHWASWRIWFWVLSKGAKSTLHPHSIFFFHYDRKTILICGSLFWVWTRDSST